MATVNVNLYVNTAQVNQNNIDTTCTFNQSSGTDEDYVTVVNVGDTVVWSGFPSDPATGNIVNITSIVDTGGPNVFTNLVTSPTPSSTVTGSVEPDTTPNGDDETYTLYFSVAYANGTQGDFHIDPKIHVNPPPPPPQMESNLTPKEKLASE
jgi:hypothetical protein